MAHRVSLIVACAAALIGTAVRVRRDQAPSRWASLVGSATQILEGHWQIADGLRKPSFVYKAKERKELHRNRLHGQLGITYQAGVEILIVASDRTAPFGSVTWLPWFMRQFHEFLADNDPVTCFVENENLERTLDLFPKVQELVEQAEIIQSQMQSSESDAAKMDWINRLNHRIRIAGLEVNEELTPANFSALQGVLKQKYDALEPNASGVEVSLYSLFKQFSQASKGLLSVRFIEDIRDTNNYIEQELADLSNLGPIGPDVQSKLSQLQPAYLKGDVHTYFKILPLLLAKMNVSAITQRNLKWAHSIHDKMQAATGNQAVVVVGADHFGRAEEQTPGSILDAFESLGYDVVPLQMLVVSNAKNRKRKNMAEERALQQG